MYVVWIHQIHQTTCLYRGFSCDFLVYSILEVKPPVTGSFSAHHPCWYVCLTAWITVCCFVRQCSSTSRMTCQQGSYRCSSIGKLDRWSVLTCLSYGVNIIPDSTCRAHTCCIILWQFDVHLLYEAAGSLCLSVCLSVPPPLLTRPSNRNQIWHTYSGRYGTHSQLKKIWPTSPQG